MPVVKTLRGGELLEIDLGARASQLRSRSSRSDAIHTDTLSKGLILKVRIDCKYQFLEMKVDLLRT